MNVDKCGEENMLSKFKKRSLEKESSLSVADNPYLQSRALWDDIYGSLQDKLENAYRIIFILASVIAIAIVALVIMATHNRIQPYLAVLHGDEVLTVHDMQSSDFNTLKVKLATVIAKEFIQTTRSVSLDDDVNRRHRIQAFSFVAGPAMQTLKRYYEKEDAKSQTNRPLTHAVIQTVLIKSSHSLLLRWQELQLDRHTGDILARDYYTAELTYAFQPKKPNAIIASHNPLGFTISDFAWAKELNINNRSPV